MKRRRFLKLFAAAGAAAGANGLFRPGVAAQPGGTLSPVYVSGSADMYSSDANAKQTAIQQGLDSCIVELARARGATNLQRVGQAWEHILGRVDASTRIAVHVTCFYANKNNMNSPQFETLKAITNGLCDMLGGSFRAGNISFFDNDMGGKHRLHTVYGESNLNTLGVEHELNEWDGNAPMTIKGKAFFPHTYLSNATYAINLARLSGHQYDAGSGPGITGCSKGIVGACSDSTDRYSGVSDTFHDRGDGWQGHQQHWQHIKNKIKVNILDMVRATRHERLAFSKDVGEICLGPDPCAVDGYASDMLRSLEDQDPDWTTFPELHIPKAVANVDANWTTAYSKADCSIPPNYDGMTDQTAPAAPANLRVEPG